MERIKKAPDSCEPGAFCYGSSMSSNVRMLRPASIASLSTVENDILTTGFYAQSFEQELLPKSNLNVSFLVRIENVTKTILDSIPFEATEMDSEEIVHRI